MVTRSESAQAEGDEAAEGPTATEDNSVGRLLALSDGVFAIGMTLLVLDLKVPSLPDDATNAQLLDALVEDRSRFATYLLSFYVVAGYWASHHRIMRSVTTTHPRLIQHTLLLLLLVAALPFPSALLAEHGNLPAALAVYGGFNLVASLVLLWLRHDVTAHGLISEQVDPQGWTDSGRQIWANVVVFALAMGAGGVLGPNGPWVLVLLGVTRVLLRLWVLARRPPVRGRAQ